MKVKMKSGGAKKMKTGGATKKMQDGGSNKIFSGANVAPKTVAGPRPTAGSASKSAGKYKKGGPVKKK